MAERVEVAKRGSISQKRRLELLLAFNGRCALCGEKIVGSFDLDHRIALINGGMDVWDNWQPAHHACHVNKTRGDVKIAAKIKRIIARTDGTRRERQKIPGGGFRKSATHKRTIDGRVVPR